MPPAQIYVKLHIPRYFPPRMRFGLLHCDLFFRSSLTLLLQRDGQEVLISDSTQKAVRDNPDVLILDVQKIGELDLLALRHAFGGKIIGYYSHADSAAKEKAHKAALDVVVARSGLLPLMRKKLRG